MIFHQLKAEHIAEQSKYRQTLFNGSASYYMSLSDKREKHWGQVHHRSSVGCKGVAVEDLPWSQRASKESRAEVEPTPSTLALIHTRRP